MSAIVVGAPPGSGRREVDWDAASELARCRTAFEGALAADTRMLQLQGALKRQPKSFVINWADGMELTIDEPHFRGQRLTTARGMSIINASDGTLLAHIGRVNGAGATEWLCRYFRTRGVLHDTNLGAGVHVNVGNDEYVDVGNGNTAPTIQQLAHDVLAAPGVAFQPLVVANTPLPGSWVGRG